MCKPQSSLSVGSNSKLKTRVERRIYRFYEPRSLLPTTCTICILFAGWKLHVNHTFRKKSTVHVVNLWDAGDFRVQPTLPHPHSLTIKGPSFLYPAFSSPHKRVIVGLCMDKDKDKDPGFSSLLSRFKLCGSSASSSAAWRSGSGPVMSRIPLEASVLVICSAISIDGGFNLKASLKCWKGKFFVVVDVGIIG